MSDPPSSAPDPAPDPATAYGRALAHLLVQAVRRAGEVVHGPPGLVGVFDADWPVSHLSNRVLVTDALPVDAGADAVLAFTDQVFAGRALTHRKVDVLDDTTGRRLTPGLVDAGFDPAPVLLMVASPAIARTPDVIRVESVDEADVRRLVEKGWQLEAPDFSAETVRQLVGRRDAAGRAGDLTRLAVRDRVTGELVAKTDLLVIDQVAEVDDVITLPDHRGRGYARALVLEAVERARRAGADLVYLEAAEDDWPQHLYGRLGFETVGCIHEYSRVGVSDPA